MQEILKTWISVFFFLSVARYHNKQSSDLMVIPVELEKIQSVTLKRDTLLLVASRQGNSNTYIIFGSLCSLSPLCWSLYRVGICEHGCS